jgi:hypothetical protein
MTAHHYSTLDRLLHRVALGTPRLRRLFFDLDCSLAGAADSNWEIEAPVYVSGLARAGTTILLEALYSTGVFTALTYRNMPFVTAPGVWARASFSHRKRAVSRERAHGDRLDVSYDSPEAFEEVFWDTIAGDVYKRNDRLLFHDIDQQGLQDYRTYVGNVIRSAGNPKRRYLAKNNNNLLRIRSIRKAFPDSVVLVPFRAPWNHANSLLRQHRRFLEAHAEDRFGLHYMNWLGHFEFGANMKPFDAGPGSRPVSPDKALEIDYWLRYWRHVYEYVLTHHADDIVLVDYDRLCGSPRETLSRLATAVQLPGNRLTVFAEMIDERGSLAGQSCIPDDVGDLYSELQKAAL